MDLSETERRAFLKEEYFFLQNQYEDFDKRALTIKGWVGGGGLVGVALSIRSDGTGGLFTSLAVIVVMLTFWSLEAIWKVSQHAHADRIRLIEAEFRSEKDVLYKRLAPFQIYHWWSKSIEDDPPLFPYEDKSQSADAEAPPPATTDESPKETEWHRREPVGRRRSYLRRFREEAVESLVFLPYLPIILIAVVSVFLRPAG